PTNILDPDKKTLTKTLTGGIWRVCGDSTMRLLGVDIVTNNATIILDGASSKLYRDDSPGATSALANFATNDTAGSFTIQEGRNPPPASPFTNKGTLIIAPDSTFTTSGAYTQTASGTTTLVGGTLTALSITNDGKLNGEGAVNGPVINGAAFAPG